MLMEAGDAYGSRQQIYERLHSGDPNMMVANAYKNFDLSEGVDLVSKFLDLEVEAD